MGVISGAIQRKDTANQPGTSVTVGAASATLLAANDTRAEVTICNDHATQVVYLKLAASAAEANKGIRLNAAGGSWTSNAYTGEIRAIATGAGTGVTVTEI